MRASVFEVADVLANDPVEMPLAEQNEVIEALPPQAASEALADGIGLRGRDCISASDSEHLNRTDAHFRPRHPTVESQELR
jgi:hypothetical protein